MHLCVCLRTVPCGRWCLRLLDYGAACDGRRSGQRCSGLSPFGALPLSGPQFLQCLVQAFELGGAAPALFHFGPKPGNYCKLHCPPTTSGAHSTVHSAFHCHCSAATECFSALRTRLQVLSIPVLQRSLGATPLKKFFIFFFFRLGINSRGTMKPPISDHIPYFKPIFKYPMNSYA